MDKKPQSLGEKDKGSMAKNGTKEMEAESPFYLCSKAHKPDQSIIQIGPVYVGSDELLIIAGPCAVESEVQIHETAAAVKRAGAHVLRGGLFKPRTSPYSFQGLGLEGLNFFVNAAKEHGLLTVTEVMDLTHLDILAQHVDILQVGSRNMQNYPLLKALGALDKPVLLKRGLSSTVEELLAAAEYILVGGNHKVVLCERGIRTFQNHFRFTPDISALPLVHELSHLPIILDPSHCSGRREWVIPVAKAAIAAGADGLMVEVHPAPDKALSDGPQSLFPHQFQQLMDEMEGLAKALGRKLKRNKGNEKAHHTMPQANL
ncbi:MAG: 3-deoxy-7-phosphoheptulonate synthase [Deltaproteobacteria bacterium]|nr:3-deoxy-7-phosphoheptulonate synthase [Deltaproteobacteria bacterium]MBW1929658.1 3-deoxy-7-phosphoheptulonate synthase [Deltaproteobacteria bacterium]MBW2027107.1 3-deoxy-7-phosphoheptulonate synthase [Deltaproteobacteria bacterium]MBW2127137.1 3-deoxy-7-phosphoheptulonate synthase [Deltaproteobacteria bacterium]RLB19838.1 MAG: 3-deoxy-7-phosphoheptulonate synthase [Deltaproteobacteria bacterium]